MAIAKAIEEKLSGRHGNNQYSETKEEVPHAAPPQEKGKARDLAAKAASFSGKHAYEAAKFVVNNGVPELQEAMDSGKASISIRQI